MSNYRESYYDALRIGRQLTPKQRRRIKHKENRALRPAKVAAPKKAPIPDPWGTGKPRAAKQYPPRPVTECLHVLALNQLVYDARGRLKRHTTFAYCYAGGEHTEHRGNGRSWS